MNERNESLIHNFVNETVMVTPKPNACSTAEKKNNFKKTDMKKVTHDWEDTARSSTDSLGILSLNDVHLDSNTIEDCDNKSYSEFNKQKELALSLLYKTQNVGKFPSCYLMPSSTVEKTTSKMEINESTINESDVLKFLNETDSKKSVSGLRDFRRSISSIQMSELFDKYRPSEFSPHENSTPRTSEFSKEYSEKLEEIKNKVLNTDISMSEVLKDFREFDSRLSEFPKVSDISSGSFIPSELAAERLKADELAWMKEYGSLVLNDLQMSDINSFVNSGNVSSGKISDFFQKKSENISNLNLNPSPEKQDKPYPLIDVTGETTEIGSLNNTNKINETSDVSFNLDTLNLISTIEKMDTNEDTKHLISMICKKGFSKNENEVESSKTEKLEREKEPIREQDYSKVKKDSSSRYSLQDAYYKVNNDTTKKSLPTSPLFEHNYRQKSPRQNINRNKEDENIIEAKLSNERAENSQQHSLFPGDDVKRRLNRAFIKLPHMSFEKQRNSGSFVPTKINKHSNEKENINNNCNCVEPPTRDTNVRTGKLKHSPSKDRVSEKYCNDVSQIRKDHKKKRDQAKNEKQVTKANYLENPNKDVFQNKSPSISRPPENKSQSQIRQDNKGKNEKQITKENYLENPTKDIFQNKSPSKSRPPENKFQLQELNSETGTERERISFKSNSLSTNELRSFSPNSCCSGMSDDKSSRGSIRSGSSLDNLPDGKLPIESTHVELIWGCVKVGKKSTQEFIIRNRSHQKVRLEASVTGSSFKILRDRHDSELRTNVQLILYPRESRTISVSFFPTSIGAAAEQLNFYPADKSLHSQYFSKQMLWLFGYGGHANVELQNITKDTRGKYWLSLGNITESNDFIKTFEIKNIGSLPAFNVFQVECRGLRKFSNINVNPSHIVIRPNEVVEVSITFYPNKDDFKQIVESMSREGVELAHISIISGPEPLRGRIRRLRNKISEQMGVVPDYPIVQTLTAAFPGDQIPPDVGRCKESPPAMKEILKCLSHKEIIVTMEQDVDQTLVGNFGCLDDSSHFFSLSHNDKTAFETTSRQFCNFVIEPDKLFLGPPKKIEDSFLITCNGGKEIYFEIIPDDQDLLQCSPQNGTVLSNEPMFVVVRCNIAKIDRPLILSKVKVYVENEVVEVMVKIVLIQNLKTTNSVT